MASVVGRAPARLPFGSRVRFRTITATQADGRLLSSSGGTTFKTPRHAWPHHFRVASLRHMLPGATLSPTLPLSPSLSHSPFRVIEIDRERERERMRENERVKWCACGETEI